MKKSVLFISLLTLLSACGGSSDVKPEETTISATNVAKKMDNSPYREDVKSIETICHAYLDVLSGSAGSPRNWNKFRYLCLPNVQFTQAGSVEEADVDQNSLEDYIEQNGGWYDNTDLEENQLSISIEKFGNMAMAFQTYESVWDDNQGDAGTEIGINSFMLAYNNDR